MKPNTQRLMSALLAIVLLIGAFVVFFDMVEPAYGNLQSVNGEIVGEQQFLTSESSTINQVQQIFSSYQQNTAEQASLNGSLPVGPDTAGAIAQLYGIAQISGISLQGVTISDSAPITNMDTAQTGIVIRPTGTIAFQLTGSGSYENLTSFLSEIETNIRIFDVTQLNVQPDSAALGKAAFSPDLF